ncbi:MAG: class I SAM-dependent methyltransferase [Candidatus Marinimicrobia bacterium]|nr:class I SAM-dependent methyltransferase [Candidatus Neomarinimicrobiota bacterium]
MNSPYIEVLDRFSGKPFQIVKCECDFRYLSPRPEYKDISSYYENESYDPHRPENKSIFQNIYGWVQKIALKWKFKHISKFIRSGSLLDIGGGGGKFCSYFQSKEWQVSLQDNSEKARFLAEKNNIETYASLSEIQNQRFNLITMWHSLEHIHAIDHLFQDVNRLISEDGVLVVAVPNVNAPERDWLGKEWAPWDAPRHLYHFSYEELSKLLRKYGWEIQYSKTMLQDTPYNILLSLKTKSLFQLIGGGFVLLYSLIKILIGGVNSSSSFMVICKKI